MAKITNEPERFNLKIDRQERYFLLLAMHLLDEVAVEGEVGKYLGAEDEHNDIDQFYCEGMVDDFIEVLKGEKK